ncbi:MAG: glycerol-3-phosphate 1-O-acyltransferase PlsY [Armatimonadetes bacterium]|nr:glycerol-3-phosphate 1-O-acyltransferase PlsY [Armatimonadota bacterium]MDW8154696.1 glycerol-3-phosphate 1-O-acyltransferase PlsY [Armatimonadota bacterium]
MGILLVVLSYFLGAVPTGLVLVRLLAGVDLREYGSGQLGPANVYRVAGPYVGAVVFLVDLLKGALPVLAAQRLGLAPAWAVAGGLASMAGHSWSVFLRFGGGRGVVTSFGVLVALSPWAAVVAGMVWGITVALTRMVTPASVLALLSIPLTMLVLREPWEYVAFGVLAATLGVYRHRGSLRRLVEEDGFGTVHRSKGR